MKNIIPNSHILIFIFRILHFESFLFRFSMAEDLNLPDGVTIPGWYRRLLEARAAAGPANVPPPPVAPSPPPPPRADTFAKTCKEFKAMSGKPLQGSEKFVEARDWLKEVEELLEIFEVEEGKSN